jgi:hypothetical protein
MAVIIAAGIERETPAAGTRQRIASDLGAAGRDLAIRLVTRPAAPFLGQMNESIVDVKVDQPQLERTATAEMSATSRAMSRTICCPVRVADVSPHAARSAGLPGSELRCGYGVQAQQ